MLFRNALSLSTQSLKSCIFVKGFKIRSSSAIHNSTSPNPSQTAFLPLEYSPLDVTKNLRSIRHGTATRCLFVVLPSFPPNAQSHQSLSANLCERRFTAFTYRCTVYRKSITPYRNSVIITHTHTQKSHMPTSADTPTQRLNK